MKWRVRRTAVLWEENPLHELRACWPQYCKRFWKNVFFIECLCCDCTLHARPLEQKGRGNKHTSLIACLATVFVSRCWGYSLGLFVFQSSSDGSEQAGTGNADALLARVLVWTLQSVSAFNSCCFVPLGSGVPDGLDGAINAVPT